MESKSFLFCSSSNCPEEIPSNKVFCMPHWAVVPHSIKETISINYDGEKETMAFSSAVLAAMRAIKESEKNS